MKYQVVLSHQNCQPPSVLPRASSCTHTCECQHTQSCTVHLFQCNWHSPRAKRKEINTETLSAHDLCFVRRYQMCCVHAAGGSALNPSVWAAQQRGAGKDLVSTPHSSLIPPSLRTAIIHDIRASRQLCTAVARAELSNTPGSTPACTSSNNNAGNWDYCAVDTFKLSWSVNAFLWKCSKLEEMWSRNCLWDVYINLTF